MMNYYNNARCVCPQPYITLQYCSGIVLDEQLKDAVRAGNTEEVNRLLDAGADVNRKEGRGMTPLEWAASGRNIDMARLLIERGANLDQGDPLLHRVVLGGNIDMARLFIESGADVNAKNDWGMTPLVWAVQQDRTDIVDLLIEKGADVDVEDDFGSTPLAGALRRDNIDIVDRLLNEGADAGILDSDGKSLIQIAALYSKNGAAMLDRLYVHGADLYNRDQRGRTALMDAVRNPDFVDRLIGLGVDVDAKDENGDTALIYAVRMGNQESVELLLTAGADPTIQNNKSESALDVARDPAIKKLLAVAIVKRGPYYYGSCYC